MAHEKSVLERAFEIAASGRVATLRNLEDALRAEGFGSSDISAGASLCRQLRLLNEGQANWWRRQPWLSRSGVA
jgi:hypothetical protein